MGRLDKHGKEFATTINHEIVRRPHFLATSFPGCLADTVAGNLFVRFAYVIHVGARAFLRPVMECRK